MIYCKFCTEEVGTPTTIETPQGKIEVLICKSCSKEYSKIKK